MKTQTLFRLGALATILTALGVTAANLMYFLGRVDTVFYIWFAYTVYILWVLAYFTLFTAQAKRNSIFVFIGFILLTIGTIFAIVQNTGEGMVVSGFLTEAQIAAAKNASVNAVNLISLWTTVIGSIFFGYGTFRAGIFPRMAGILMIVLGVLWIFNDNPIAFPIYAVLLSITWGLFGWSMWNLTHAMAT